MKVDTSIPHHFPGKPIAVFARIMGFCLALSFAVWILLFDGANGSRRELGAQFVSVVVFIVSPFWVVGVWRAITNHSVPVIEVSGSGVLDRRVIHSPIPWADVANVRTMSAGSFLKRNNFLKIQVKSSGLLRARQHIDQKFIHILNYLGKPTLVLSPLALRSSYDTLETVVDAFWNEHNSHDVGYLASSTVN